MKYKISWCYQLVSLFYKFIFKVLYRGKVYGEENIPQQGAFILASNHVSFLDPPLIAVLCKRQPIFAFARSTLFKRGFVWFLKRLNMIPVDREKGHDIKAVKQILNILADGYPILMFPEGTRSATGILQRGKRGIGLFVKSGKVPVLPVRIFGTFEALPKGQIWPRFRPKISVVYGKLITQEDFAPCLQETDPLQAISDRVMQAISNIQAPTSL